MAQYETLGHYYDALVGDDHACDQWVDWIESFHPGKTFLELACGSGEITARLAKNHQVSALDLSASMLEAAKTKEEANQIEFFLQDMRNLANFDQFDTIGCFCDSFNYLIEEAEVQDFFKQIHDHLNENGLFLFDSHGNERLQEFADEYEEAGTFDDGPQVQWVISAEGDLIYQDFAFFLNGTSGVIQEHHLQRVYPLEKLLAWLDQAGFEVISCVGDFGLEPLETCEKYFIAARKI